VPISSPEVTIETILTNGFNDIIANAAKYIPLILANFPTDYQTEAIAYLTGPNFKVNTFFGYAYDPSLTPVFNIVLSSESEGTGPSRQMYLGDIVEAADDNPNTEDYEKFGSMWSASISVIVRCQKSRQTIILYALTKWLMLKNRITLETAGIMATKFSGSDLVYDKTKEPTFAFSRTWKMDCLVFNTYDLDITSDPTLLNVISAFGQEVRDLSQEQVED
jgi:hypothetical protein